MVTSRDNIRSDTACGPPGNEGALRPSVDATVVALAHLLGRQAAREAFRAARAAAESPDDPAPPSPATLIDED